MRVLCYYFSMQLTDAFYSLLSFPWFNVFLNGDPFLASFFTLPPAPLSVMLDAKLYFETRDSACSP